LRAYRWGEANFHGAEQVEVIEKGVDRHREHVRPQALVAEGCEESGPELHAHRKHEQNETALLQEAQRRLIDPLSIVPDQDAGEEHACGPQCHAALLDGPQRQSRDCDGRQQKDGVPAGYCCEMGTAPSIRVLRLGS
jgi:hypothetical protein